MSVVLELTERERSVLDGMARGRSNSDIGRELYLSEDTIKTHARRLFRKLGARDRAHAVALAYQTGVLEAPPHPDDDVVIPEREPVAARDPAVVAWGPAHPKPTITLSMSDRDAALLACAVWPRHMDRPLTIVRAREALARLTGATL